MIHITTVVPSVEGEPECSVRTRMFVYPTDMVDPILEEYSVRLDDPTMSSYYESAFIVGKDIPLCTEKTFAQCDIKPGDTLYCLLGIRNLSLFIHDDFIDHEITLPPVLPTLPVSNLRKILNEHFERRMKQTSAQELIHLKFGHTFLDDHKTLADYNVQKYDVIHLCKPLVTVRVPTYAKMEQILFMPQDTIAHVKHRVEMKMPDLEDTRAMREVYPVGLRGAVKMSDGAITYVYLDLFSEEMKMLVIDSDTPSMMNDAYLIDSEYTMGDVQRIIMDESRVRGCADDASGDQWPKNPRFDHAWTSTFAPQIEAKPLSWSTPMPLFFFPLRMKTVQLGDFGAKQFETISKLVTSLCQGETDMKGLRRYMYHPQTNTCLIRKSLYNYSEIFSTPPYSVILTKPYKTHQQVTDVRSKRMKVQVRWTTRPEIPTMKFNVNPDGTINTLRDDIEDVMQVPYFMQKLLFNGEPLDSNRTFGELMITYNSILDLLPSLNFG